MNKKITTLFYLILGINFYAQTGKVGINTENPQATLDINGNLIVGDAHKTTSTNVSTVVRDNTTGELMVYGSDNADVKPINYMVYRINNVNGDWLSGFDTKIPTDQYTVSIIGSRFESGSTTASYLLSNHSDSRVFSGLNIYSYQSNGTWWLSADYVGAGSVNSSGNSVNGSWVLYCLVINNSMIQTLPQQTFNLGGRNVGQAPNKPNGL